MNFQMVPNDALTEDVAMLGVGVPPPSVFLFGQCAVRVLRFADGHSFSFIVTPRMRKI